MLLLLCTTTMFVVSINTTVFSPSPPKNPQKPQTQVTAAKKPKYLFRQSGTKTPKKPRTLARFRDHNVPKLYQADFWLLNCQKPGPERVRVRKFSIRKSGRNSTLKKSKTSLHSALSAILTKILIILVNFWLKTAKTCLTGPDSEKSRYCSRQATFLSLLKRAQITRYKVE